MGKGIKNRGTQVHKVKTKYNRKIKHKVEVEDSYTRADLNSNTRHDQIRESLSASAQFNCEGCG